VILRMILRVLWRLRPDFVGDLDTGSRDGKEYEADIYGWVSRSEGEPDGMVGGAADPFPASTPVEQPIPFPRMVNGYWTAKVASMDSGDSIVVYTRSQRNAFDRAVRAAGLKVRQRKLNNGLYRLWIFDPDEWGDGW